MPIYEYECISCRERFELLVREGTRVECPRCRTERVKKLYSVFGISLGRPAAGGGGGG